MSFVGIRCTYNDFDLRRDLLLFDRLALPFLETTVRSWSDGVSEERARLATDLEWLANKDIVFVPSLHVLESGPSAPDYQEYLRIRSSLSGELQAWGEYLREHPPGGTTLDHLSRALSGYIDTTGDADILVRL